MESSLLFQTLAQYCSPSMEEKELLKSFLKEEEFPAGKLLQRQGHPPNKIWFISEGFVIGNYLEQGEQHTSLFCPPGEFAVSLPAFIQQGISPESLITRQDCHLLSLSYENLRELRNIPSLSRAYKGIIAHYQEESLQRMRSLLYDSPAVRMQKLLDRYPGLLKSAYPEEVASYLGISRRTLYRFLLL